MSPVDPPTIACPGPPRRPDLRRSRLVWLLVAAILPAAVAAADAPASDEPQVRAILNHWIEALGGPWEIKDLTSVDYSCKIRFGTAAPIDTYVRATATGAYRYDYTLPTYGQLTQAFDGHTAWEKNDTLGFGPLSASEHALNLAGVDFRAPLRIGSEYPERRLLPEETIDGRRLQVVKMVDRGGTPSKWYFDPVTGLRVRITVIIGAVSASIEFSDFRHVQGIVEPFRIVRRFGAQVIDVTLLSALYNEPADPLLFAPPTAWLDEAREVERILLANAAATGSVALGQVHTRVTKAVTENTNSGVRGPVTVFQKKPNLYLCQQDVPGMGTLSQGFNGQIGWAWSELEGYRTMAGAELLQMLGSADLEGPLRLRALCPLRRLLEEKQEGGRTMIGIALASAQGPAGNFYFDTKTYHLVRAETFIQTGPSGQMKVVDDFSDFRTVDGVTMPFAMVMTNPAMRVITKIESVEQNVPLDDAIFQPKKGD